MMKIKQRHWILIGLFLTFFISRSLISLQSKNFSDDNSYYVMRQIEYIAKTGKPLHEDILSYGGRNFIIMPFYYYLMGGFYKLFPNVFVLKIINNLLASFVVVSMYLLSAKILKNRTIALFSGVVASGLPIYLNETINSLNPYSLTTPLAFFILWLFLEINEKMLNYLIPFTIIFILSSFDSILLVIGLLSYIIYVYLENKKLEKLSVEYTSFFLLFFLWVNFIIYKEAFQVHGFSVLFFQTELSLKLINYIGIPLLLGGLYTIFMYSSKKKSVYMTLIISLFLSNVLLLWLKLVPKSTIILIGMYLVILMGQLIRDLNTSLPKLKMSKHTNLIMLCVFSLIILIQVVPNLFLLKQGFDDKYIKGFEWIKENTDLNSTIMSIPEEGHLISYISKRKNVIDSEYILVDYEKRKQEILEMYTQKFKTNILSVLDNYDADYIILSDKLLKYDIRVQDTIFFTDPCFDLVYNGEIKVFKKCEK